MARQSKSAALYAAREHNSKMFNDVMEQGAKEFGPLWLDANAWAISVAGNIRGVTYYEHPFKALIARVVLCTLRRALPKKEPKL